ncbi:hypothetical protein Tco_0509240 [Tanacetum coccineum]
MAESHFSVFCPNFFREHDIYAAFFLVKFLIFDNDRYEHSSSHVKLLSHLGICEIIGDNVNDDMVMDLDLNLEPIVDPTPVVVPPVTSFAYAPLWNELETAHGRIEDRIRQLEAVTARARARARQRWRHTRNNPENSYMGGNGNEDGNANVVVDVEDADVFYRLSYVDSSAKECPVCKGEVTDFSITPIYGNGKNQRVSKLESGENTSKASRIRIGIGSIGENPLLQGLGVGPGSESTPSLLHASEAGSSRRHSSRPFSRVISESAASLSSISSALNNVERLVEDLETYINDRLLRRTAEVQRVFPSNLDLNNFLASTAEIQEPEPHNAEMNADMPLSCSSQRSVATTVVQVDNLSTDSVEIDLTVSHPHDIFVLLGFCDSDWAKSIEDRRNTSSYCFLLGTTVVSWKSRKETTVALSLTEAKYVAATESSCQGVWLRRILADLGQEQVEATTIMCDNISTVMLARNPILHGRTKHIKIKHHYIRELIAKREVRLKSCGTNEQAADLLTKALPQVKHDEFKAYLEF